MADTSSDIPFPYREGQTLTLSVSRNSVWVQPTIEVKITRVIQPSTMSVVMEVEAPGASLTDDKIDGAILKLYDPRFSAGLRGEYKAIGPYSQDRADSYREFVSNGDAERILVSKYNPADEDTYNVWDLAQQEIECIDSAREFHESEVEAYRRLWAIQGKHVPIFYGDVRFKPWSASSPPPTGKEPYFEISGVLLEPIKGFFLKDLADNAPQSAFCPILDEAVYIANLISDQDICNKDTNPRNVMVRSPGKDSAYEVVFIDFGHCTFRERDQSEESWVHDKDFAREEAMVGREMEIVLKRRGYEGVYKYEPSYRYWCVCNECCPPSTNGPPPNPRLKREAEARAEAAKKKKMWYRFKAAMSRAMKQVVDGLKACWGACVRVFRKEKRPLDDTERQPLLEPPSV